MLAFLSAVQRDPCAEGFIFERGGVCWSGRAGSERERACEHGSGRTRLRRLLSDARCARSAGQNTGAGGRRAGSSAGGGAELWLLEERVRRLSGCDRKNDSTEQRGVHDSWRDGYRAYKVDAWQDARYVATAHAACAAGSSVGRQVAGIAELVAHAGGPAEARYAAGTSRGGAESALPQRSPARREACPKRSRRSENFAGARAERINRISRKFWGATLFVNGGCGNHFVDRVRERGWIDARARDGTGKGNGGAAGAGSGAPARDSAAPDGKRDAFGGWCGAGSARGVLGRDGTGGFSCGKFVPPFQARFTARREGAAVYHRRGAADRNWIWAGAGVSRNARRCGANAEGKRGKPFGGAECGRSALWIGQFAGGGTGGAVHGGADWCGAFVAHAGEGEEHQP